MDLKTYIESHDGTVRTDGPELLRLAKAARCAPSYLFVLASTNGAKTKRIGPLLARRLADESIGKRLSVHDMRTDIFGDEPAPTKRRTA